MKLIFIPLYDEGMREEYWLLSSIVDGDNFDLVKLPTGYEDTDCWLEYNTTLIIHTKTEDIDLIEGDEYSTEELNRIKRLFDKAKKNLENVRSEIQKEKKDWENQNPIIMEVK